VTRAAGEWGNAEWEGRRDPDTEGEGE
jgi:hypothetical protein